MNRNRMRHRSNRTQITFVFALVLMFGSVYVLTPTQAQSPAKKALTVEDYPRWRSISGQELSGNGKWVAYGLSSANTVPAEAKPALHILNLETSQDVEVQNATGADFSPDSRWIVYQVDPGGAHAGLVAGAGRNRRAALTPRHRPEATHKAALQAPRGGDLPLKRRRHRGESSCAICQPARCSPGRRSSRSRFRRTRAT